VQPAWQDFEAEERAEYPEMATKSFSKPMAVLRTVLEAEPDGIGLCSRRDFYGNSNIANFGRWLPIVTNGSS